MNLLGHARDAFLHAEGTSGLGWVGDKIVVPLCAFVLALVVLLIIRGRQSVKDHVGKTVSIALAASFGVFIIWHGAIFSWSIVRTVYDDHQTYIGANRDLKSKLDTASRERDDWKKKYENLKAAKPQVVKVPVTPQTAATTEQARGFSELQSKILSDELRKAVGASVRINSIGNHETMEFANELASFFKGWNVIRNHTGSVTHVSVGCDPGSPSELEFAIPSPQDGSVQVAVHAFDRARVKYSINVSTCSYRGSATAGTPPPLTINVRDRR